MEEQYITTSLAVTLSHRNVQKDAETLKEVVKGKYLEVLSMDIRKKKDLPHKRDKSVCIKARNGHHDRQRWPSFLHEEGLWL